MRLLFAGTPTAAVPALRLLLDSPRHQVVAVLTRPDAPSGRGRVVARSPVAQVADEAGVPVLTPQRPGEPGFVQTLTELAPDCAPVVAYGALLPASVLLVPRLGWINLHFSLLPAWRGAAPVQHAVLNGDQITGATTFLIEAGLDSGPVFGVTTEPIGPHDTSGDLLDRLSVSGAGLLAATLDALADGEVAPRAQPTDGVSLAPKLSVEDAHIDFTHPALAVDRRIRACTPAPGAWATWRGDRLRLGPAHVAAVPAGELAPGRVRVEPPGRGRVDPPSRERVDIGAVLVGTSTRPVVLGTVQPAGRRPMAATDWARGARPGDDERLG